MALLLKSAGRKESQNPSFKSTSFLLRTSKRYAFARLALRSHIQINISLQFRLQIRLLSSQSRAVSLNRDLAVYSLERTCHMYQYFQPQYEPEMKLMDERRKGKTYYRS